MKHVSARSVLGALAALGVLAATPAFAASSDVTLATPTGTVYGTLDVPDGVKAPMPVALIIAGSGPTDRDGNNPLGVTSASYRLRAGSRRCATTSAASPRARRRYRSLRVRRSSPTTWTMRSAG